MTKLEELHKVKDQAMRALEKRNFDRAAQLYLEIADRDPDPDWRQRAGDAFRRAGDSKRAVEVLNQAADGYARGGFLLKAIAVSKTLLQLDPQNTTTQALLADLYAKRDASAAKPVVTGVDRPMPAPLRPPGVPAPPATAPAPPVVASVAPPPPVRRSETSIRAMPDLITSPIELFASPGDHSRPIEILPLNRVLGGKRAEPFSESGTFEIMLDDADVVVDEAEVNVEDDVILDDDVAVELPPATPPAIAHAPVEMDWSDMNDDASRNAAPIVVGMPPAETVAPVAALPKIPLFSSLPTADLLLVIQRMALHEVEPGAVVVREGDRGGSLYVIVDGEVAVTVGEGVTARELARLAQGAFFGELGLLTDDPRSATVTATQPTRLLEISRELAWEVIQHAPEVLRTLLRFFRDRMLDRLVDVSPLFSGLPREEASSLAAQFVLLELEPGAVPIKVGARSPGLYFMMCGECEVVRDGQRLGTLGPGDVFGEMSMLLRSPAMADVRALRKTWVLQLPQSRFQEVMLTYPQVLAYVSELGDQRAKVPGPDEPLSPTGGTLDMTDSRRIEIA